MTGREYDQGARVLPVLDLMAGEVVAARAGERARYAPIRSPLAAASAPADLLAALLARSGAQEAYLADLDAIMRGRPQSALVAGLLAAFPGVRFWLDAGFHSAAAALQAVQALAPDAAARVLPVLGSESLAAHEDLSAPGLAGRCVLSLDFGVEGFRGDPAWWQDARTWPQRVIVMSLAHVGVGGGPDLARLAEACARAGPREVLAAGGVRSAQDLIALRRIGVSGALVATALHQGRLGDSGARGGG